MTNPIGEGRHNNVSAKYWLIALAVLWVSAVISVGLVPLQRDFDWSSFVVTRRHSWPRPWR